MNKIDTNSLSVVTNNWFLLTAGTADNFNTMTAGWGQCGFIWQLPVFTAYVRPNRHTYGFTEGNELFTASFLDMKKYKNELGICGSKSGRDIDKIKETGLTPIELDGAVAFAQAKEIYVCRKLYVQEMSLDSFVDKKLPSMFYADDNNPKHTMYVGEIIAAYSN